MEAGEELGLLMEDSRNGVRGRHDLNLAARKAEEAGSSPRIILALMSISDINSFYLVFVIFFPFWCLIEILSLELKNLVFFFKTKHGGGSPSFAETTLK